MKGDFVHRQRCICYTPVDYILLFFMISFFGWIWEVLLTWFQQGHFANRGVLFGPWLPLYGSGAILVLVLLRRWLANPGLTFLLSAGLCSLLEYSCGWILERSTGLRWWDYSQYRFDVQGRISLESALVFGLASCIVIYWAAPKFGLVLERIPVRGKWRLALALLVLFGLDALHAWMAPNIGPGVAQAIPAACQILS